MGLWHGCIFYEYNRARAFYIFSNMRLAAMAVVVWRVVDEFCSLGFDESRMLNWPQPWSEGHLSWKIPYGWKHKDSTSSVCVGQIEPPTYSTWTMRTNFIEKVKHDRRIGVSLSGQMFFEGVLQNGNQ